MKYLNEKMLMYRQEYPKPQFERENWLNLNGEWDFEIDYGESGEQQKWYENHKFSQKIIVPFCPESKLSGIENTDFMKSIWYKRTVFLNDEQIKEETYLHFGAVDYFATIYVNGIECGTHKGGYVSFKVNITKAVKVGENSIVVHAQDDTRSPIIPSGKQSGNYYSKGCYYTRTTGIWQTVWLEFVPKTHLEKVKYYPDIYNQCLHVLAEVNGDAFLHAKATFERKEMGEVRVKCKSGEIALTIPLKEKHLWEVGKGGLYDIEFCYGEDKVKSYFGLRSVRMDGYQFFLNDKSVFQRLVLDQGFYPDGIYTAPTDKDLEKDIDISMSMGFNGARLHEKIFEERFLYYCDKKGYMVWGEYPNWGLQYSHDGAIGAFLPEWLETVERDFNHPCIIGWCPFNEVWTDEKWDKVKHLLQVAYAMTKLVDGTRPCIDTSGGIHRTSDVYDVHDYTQEPDVLKSHFEKIEQGEQNNPYGEAPYAWLYEYPVGKPIMVSEYGGIGWNSQTGWCYGTTPKTEEEFYTRLESLTNVLLNNECIFGFCYTQLVDVEQEQNGLYTYDRTPKFDNKRLYKIFSKKAKIEG